MVIIVDGVILAGGKASRMKQNKMLLSYKGQPLIYHSVSKLLQICENVTIVTGYYNIDYMSYFPGVKNLKIVQNINHLKGMFSSVKKGIEDVQNDCFIIPGDYPLVKLETYKKILLEEGVVRVPIYKDRKGHPIFFKKEIVEELKKEPIESSLKAFRDKYKVNYINVDDEGVVLDVDTINDYEKIITQERNDSIED